MPAVKFLDTTGLSHFWGKVKDNDVKQSYSEIETQTETATEHVQPDGTLEASPDQSGYYANGSFYIYIIGTLEEENHSIEIEDSPNDDDGLWIGNFEDEEGNKFASSNPEDDYDSNSYEWLKSIQMQANERYCYEFQINPDATYNEIMIMLDGCAFYDENDIREPFGNMIAVAGSDWHSDLEYTPGVHSSIEHVFPSVAFTLPAIGESTALYFNAWVNYDDDGNYRRGIIPERYRNKTLTIENVDGTNCKLWFYWDTSKDVETTTTQKMLKTTIEKEDETEIVVSKPLSGLLQNMSASIESSLAIETSQSESGSSEECMILLYLADEAEPQ